MNNYTMKYQDLYTANISTRNFTAKNDDEACYLAETYDESVGLVKLIETTTKRLITKEEE